MNTIIPYILSALAALIILTVHEFSHGYVAFRLGDDTAKNAGRLSLNPLKHLDLFGTISLVLFRFGWAKPVPINPRNFKNPKRDFALTALAGPLSNLILSFFSGFFYLLLNAGLQTRNFATSSSFYSVYYSALFLYIFHFSNLGIALFNLIPIPPLDGSRILNVLLPPKAYFAVMRYERIIYFVLIGWLLLGTYLSRFLLSIPLVAGNPVTAAIARLFSLSDLLYGAIERCSDLILSFWRLIPFLNV